MANFDPFSFTTFEKHFVGFDSLFKKLNEASETITKSIPNYPPYNIAKIDENKYVIELAVAGFGKQNLEVTTEDGTLTISGHTTVDDFAKEGLNLQYLHKGIAERNFTRKFSIADTVEIKNAELINGMLKVWLENIIPDHKKPKKVEVKDAAETSSKLLLEKDNDVK